ncbi:MAG: hypothetical protein HFE86_00720 [Clostridiales bacterium]|nr:hypothetical protein [Clostridiales bacterium]
MSCKANFCEALDGLSENLYKKVIPTNSYNTNEHLGRGIIYCQEAEKVRITGGVINGNGFYNFNSNDPANHRPCILYTALCRDLYVENASMLQSPYWILVPLETDNITIRNVNVIAHVAPNRDGIDPVNCNNVTIENCCVFAGDDAICPKSGNDVPSHNMDVRNCVLQSCCNGIKLGTDSRDDFKNYTFTDICIKNVGLTGNALETTDGSAIENMTFKRIDMIDVDNAMFAVVGNRGRLPLPGEDGQAKQKLLGYIRNVTVKDMNYTNPMQPPYSHRNEHVHEVMLIGLDPAKNNIQDGKDHRISNVLFQNVYLEMPGGKTSVPGFSGGIGGGYPEHTGIGESTGWAYTIRWTDNVQFEHYRNVSMNPDVRQEIARADYTDEEISEPIEALYALGRPDISASLGTAEEDLPLPKAIPVLLENY